MQVRAIIHGRVQGVFYRAWTQQQAHDLELKGWVRNLEDGNVELLAQGEKEPLEQLLRLCQKGPPAAQVEKVTTEWLDEDADYKDFSIVR